MIRELRRASPGVQIMVLTASVDPETGGCARAAGASVTLPKAASKNEILAAVRRLID